jgi:hypothetical protein
MQNLESQNIRGLFDKNADIYKRLSEMALLPAVLSALSIDIALGEPTEQKECDLAKGFFTECRYDKVQEYIETGKFEKIDGVWHIEFENNFRLDNLRGNCGELASKLGTLLQLAFPQRMFMLIEDQKNIANWNHYAVMDFTKSLEEFGLKFDLSEYKDLESLHDGKLDLFEKIRNSTMLGDLLIFDPSYSEATTFNDYRDRKSFWIHNITVFEKMKGSSQKYTVTSGHESIIPFYKKKIDGINGFGVSLVFDNRWSCPKFGVLNDNVTEYIDIDQSAFESQLLQKAGLDHDDIQHLIDSVKKLDIKA